MSTLLVVGNEVCIKSVSEGKFTCPIFHCVPFPAQLCTGNILHMQLKSTCKMSLAYWFVRNVFHRCIFHSECTPFPFIVLCFNSLYFIMSALLAQINAFSYSVTRISRGHCELYWGNRMLQSFRQLV